MSLLQGWKGFREFRKLPWEWRNLVFYSETGQDWHQFSGLIEELNSQHGCHICYVSSDAADPGLQRQHPLYRSIYLPEGFFLTLFFQVQQADVVVLTFMDLGNLHLKRSVHPVHYLYVFHSMGSTHMVDHANSFDHYDTLFCTGPHQVKEIRRREELQQLPAKSLFEYGHPRLEQVMRQGRQYRLERAQAASKSAPVAPLVLVAPTWGETSLFHVCGAELMEKLLQAGMQVVMRPHYQSNRQHPEVVSRVRQQFEGRAGFRYIDQMDEIDSLLDSSVLVTDWSAMALEYSLGLEKPVLFVDVPRRIRNPDWEEWGIEPMESAIRSEVGHILPVDGVGQAADAIQRLLAEGPAFTARMRALRESLVFNLGHSVQRGAEEIARLAEQCRQQRLQRSNHG